MSKLKIMSTVHPPKQLTYQEWVDELRVSSNVIVSSKYFARTIEKRILIDEANQLREEMENSKEKISDGTAGPRILFGKLKTILNF